MASWAKPGVKVQCILPNDNVRTPLPITHARVGVTYTIREVFTSKFDGTVAIRVEEIINPISPLHGHEYGHRLSRFRPITTKTQEQDTEMFLRIANDTPFHVMIDEELYPID